MGIDIEHIEQIETVGQLIEATAMLEVLPATIQAVNPTHPDSQAAKAKRQGEFYYYRLVGVVQKSPGIAELKLLAGRESNWTADWLREHRKDVATTRRLTAAEIDAMSVLEFVQALRYPSVLSTAEAGGDAGDDPRPADRGEQPSLEARALAILTDHPDWTDTQIATAVECSRTSLYRLDKFKAARELLRQSGRASQAYGNKTDGRIEAWEAEQ